MKKLLSILLTMPILLLLAVPVFATKTQETSPIADEDTLVKYWMLWNSIYRGHREDLRRDDGSYTSWDCISAGERGINVGNTFFYPTSEDGTDIWGVPSTAELKQLCDKMQYEINKSHEDGVKISAYTDDVQFDAREAEKMGLDLDDICARNGDKYYTNDQWFSVTMNVACINSPTWRNWLKANMKVIAEAGFDAVQYDYAPYLCPGVFCCNCKYCKESWSHYKEDELGSDKELLLGNMYFEDEIYREYFRWRAKCLTDFFTETISGAKEVNPDFVYMQNNNVNTYTFGYESLAENCFDMNTSEFGGMNAGYASTMYIYQLNEGFGYHELLSMFNNTGMCSPLWRYKVAIAESYAVNGGISFFDLDFANYFLDFLDEHKDLFLNTKSSAKTAILYSNESNLFSVDELVVGETSGIYHDNEDTTGALSKYLTKSQITHDYLCVEKEDWESRVDRYDVFIVPSYKYFEDEAWSKVLEKVMASGKSVIVIGKEAKEYISDYADGAKSSVKYLTKLGTALISSVEEVNGRRITFLNNKSNAECNVRYTDENHETVHLIRLGGDDMAEALSQSFEMTVPANKKVSGVRIYCPFNADKAYEIGGEWNEADKVLTVNTNEFDTYAVVEIEYEDTVDITEPEIILGDVNSDGTINAKDASALIKHLAGMDVTVDRKAADYNEDGNVNAKDLSKLLKYLAS